MDRGERMMRGIPAVFFLIPFEHRKIGHPKEVEALGIEQAVLVRVLLCGIKAELATRREDGFLRAALDAAISSAGPSSQQQQILFRGAAPPPNERHRFRVVAFQPLDIVVDAESSLL